MVVEDDFWYLARSVAYLCDAMKRMEMAYYDPEYMQDATDFRKRGEMDLERFTDSLRPLNNYKDRCPETSRPALPHEPPGRVAAPHEYNSEGFCCFCGAEQVRRD